MNTYHLFRVKEGKLDQWKEWCSLLATIHLTEAKETLVEENIKRETCTLFMMDNVAHVLGTAEFFDNPIPANMDRELNRKHVAMKNECLVKVSKGENLYDIVA